MAAKRAAPIDDDRASFTFALQGGPDRKGEIAFGRMSELAENMQLELLRLARAHVDRDRAGRTPDELAALTRLSLAGVRDGSTELVIKGPSRVAELTMEGLPADIGSVVMAEFIAGLQAVNEHRELPDVFAGPATETMEDLLKTLDDVPVVVIKDIRGLHGAPEQITFQPRVTRELLLAQTTQIATTERDIVLTGVLFEVNLHTGQYQIEDDSGAKSRCNIETMSAELMRPLLGKRVRARGTARYDRKGRFQRLDVVDIQLAEHEQMTIEGWRQEVPIMEMLGLEPVAPSSLESFAIGDLAPGESEELREILRSL